MNKNYAKKILAIIAVGALLCGCAASQESRQAAQTTDNDTVLVSQAYAQQIDLSDRFDAIIGAVRTREGKIVVAGIRQDAPYVSLIDIDGNETTGFIPENEDLRDVSIYGICENVDGGFALWFSSRLVVYDKNENVRWIAETPEISAEYYRGPFQLFADQYAFWNNKELYIYGRDGLKERVDAPVNTEYFSFAHAGDLSVAYTYVSNEAESAFQVQLVNTGADDLKKIAKMREQPSPITQYSGWDDAYPLNDNLSLLTYNRRENAFEKRFDWAQVGLEKTAARSVLRLNDEEILCAMIGDASLYRIQMEKERVEKKRITVGAIADYSYRMEDYISKFNAENETYYAEAIFYDHDNQQQLQTELITGLAPDVLCTTEMNVPLTETVFTDLLPFLDADETLNRSDFVQNVFDAMLIDGKMLEAMDTFEAYTIVGRTAEIGDRNTWTTQDVIELMEQYPDRYIFSCWMTPENLLGWSCLLAMGQFVDLDTMTCDFEDEDFIKLLEFSAAIENQIAPEDALDYDEKILLQFEYMQHEREINRLKINYGNAELNFIGFPNQTGINGTYLAPSQRRVSFAIPQQTKDKEAAWQLIRGIYDDAWQQQMNSFPLVQHSLDKRINALKEDADAIVDREEIDRFMEVIYGANMFFHPDLSIYNIILEEAMAYIHGDKTAEETARIIQSRVSLVLEERK